jgi:Domain of Unknown Function (DUF349).
MEHNLQLKTEICEAAESLMNSEEWKKATDELIALQARWKEIGAVSRRHSDAIWKRFRAACDKFFERKASHFASVDGEYEENLRQKLALLDEMAADDVKAGGYDVIREVPAPLGRDRVRDHTAEGCHPDKIQGRRRCAVQHAARFGARPFD